MQKERYYTKGFSLVEVILASAVFVLFVTAFSGSYLYGEEATMLSGSRARATMLANEGLEAVRNIRDSGIGIANIPDGTFGLKTENNQWEFSGISDMVDIFTREIVITTLDSRRKLVTSNVTWQQNPQRTGSVTVIQELSAWQCANQATLLDVDVSGASLETGNRNLVGIMLKHPTLGCGELTIDKITVSWVPLVPTNRRMENIFVNGISSWTGSVGTGTEVNINDAILPEGTPPQTNKYYFSHSMNNKSFTIVFTMIDGSSKTVLIL